VKVKNMLISIQKFTFLLPALLLLFLLTGYPLYDVIKMSLHDYYNPRLPVFAGLSNYTQIFTPAFWNSLMNTLVFTFGTVAGVLVLGMATAALLNQSINTKIRAFLRSILIFPWLLSSAVTAALWVYLIRSC